MKAKHSRLIVVDASVARAAGESEHPVSSSCRRILIAIREICHRVVMTEALQDEWGRHEGSFAVRWRASMCAKKKTPRTCAELQLSRLDEVCEHLSPGEQAALRKDIHLIEAACAADGIIITHDREIMAIWEKCSDQFKLPKAIRWIDPVACDPELLKQL
jgi:hypothetical protein